MEYEIFREYEIFKEYEVLWNMKFLNSNTVLHICFKSLLLQNRSLSNDMSTSISCENYINFKDMNE